MCQENLAMKLTISHLMFFTSNDKKKHPVTSFISHNTTRHVLTFDICVSTLIVKGDVFSKQWFLYVYKYLESQR